MKVLKADFRLMGLVGLVVLALGVLSQDSLAQVVALTPGIISSIAGNGSAGYGGDGNPAGGSTLSEPFGVAVDSNGNVYIADSANNRIRVVSPKGGTILGVSITAGDIVTVAGNGTAGYSGDSGAATSAELDHPTAVALDSSGNLYIADEFNNRIRMVNTSGTISTVAGNGTDCSPSTAACGDGGAATNAELSFPVGVAVGSSGDIYIADTSDNRIREVSAGNIATVAGNGTAGYSGDGNPATSAKLNSPTGVAVDANGNIYIADEKNNVVRVVSPSGGTILNVSISAGDIATVAGNGTENYYGDGGPAISAELALPTGVTLDSAGDLYIADLDNYRIRKVDVFGTITTVAGSSSQCSSPTASPACGDGGVATNAQLSSPHGVALDSAGDIYIADESDNRVREVTVSTSTLTFTPAVNWYQTGGTQNVAVSNVGSAAITSLSFGTVPNFSESNDCTTPLAIGATCTVSETFTPTAPASPLTQTVAVADNAPNTPQTISLSGTANPVTPVFSNLTPSPTVPDGTSSITLSGTIGLGGYYPAAGETISVSINGQPAQNTTIENSTGGFELLYSLGTLSTTPGTYTITYSYGGDTSFTSASNSSTSLTISPSNSGGGEVFYTVSIAFMGTGSGSVQDTAGQIYCIASNDTQGGPSCSGSYQAGTTVQLNVSATAPSTFGGWGTGANNPCAYANGNPPNTSCSFTVTGNVTVTPDLVSPPVTAPLNNNYCTSGSNNTASYQLCPSGNFNAAGVCTDPNGVLFTVQIPVVQNLNTGTCFSLQATFTEVTGTGICPESQVGSNGYGFPSGPTTDFDCRFVDYYNYGTTDQAGDVLTPLCYPYLNGNCVFYHLELLSGNNSMPLTPSQIPAGVLWQIDINPSNAPPPPYAPPGNYNSSPRMLDDPDFDETTPSLPWGTSCTTPMDMEVSGVYGTSTPTTSPAIYCQFDNDITTFFLGTVGGDAPTAGGKTKVTNDVVLAFLPTSNTGTGSPTAAPPTPVAPSIELQCDAGCTPTGDLTSGSTVTLTEGTAAAAQVTETVSPYPTPTLIISMTGTTSVTAMESGSTVTLTTYPPSSNFGSQFAPGVYVVVDNCLTAAYDGAFLITGGGSGTNTLTYTNTATGLSADSGGECMVTALPDGLTFNLTTGALSGTPGPGSPGSYPVTFTATNTAGTSSASYTLVISQISSSTAIASSLNPSINGNSVTFTATVTPATATGTVAFDDGVNQIGTGTLTSGVATFSTSGLASGTHSITANYLGDTNDTASASSVLTQTVREAPSITSGNSTTFTVGTPGSFMVTTAAATYPTASFSESGTLPTGVTLTDNGNGTATLGGTPAPGTGGVYNITINASNIAGSASQGFTLTVDQAPAITSVNNTTFTVGMLGSFTVTATGYPAPSFSVTAGTLPNSVTLSSAGSLSGTPAAGTGGTYTITVTASNGVGTNATQSFTLTVDQAPAITSSAATTFTVGTSGSFTVTATGYPAPSFSVTAGTLPNSVTLSSAGSLSGTPAAGTGGTYAITISASNGVGTAATQSFTLTVDQAPAITSASSTTFTVGTSGSFAVTATGFPAPSFSVTAGSLPSGVSLSTAGVLSGTPVAGTGGTYAITISASNGVLPNATQSFTLTVDQAPAITSANSATFTAGVGGTFTVTTSGFPTVSTITETGALPSGVSFTNNGNGTATISVSTTAAAGGTTFTITASNGVGTNATQSFTLTVAAAWTISPSSYTFPTISVGQTETYTFTVTNHTSAAVKITATIPGNNEESNPQPPGDPDDFQFTVNGCNITLAAGASCNITVKYIADSDNLTLPPPYNYAYLTITNSSGTVLVQAYMTGRTVDPTVTLTTDSNTFTSTTAVTQMVATLSNPSGQPTDLILGNLSISSGGSYYKLASGTNSCTNGATMAPGATCYIYVTFTPPSSGTATETGNVCIPSNAANGTLNVSLSGKR